MLGIKPRSSESSQYPSLQWPPPPQHTNFGFVFLLPIAFEVQLSVSFNPTSWSILIFILSPPLPSHTAWSTTLLKVLLLVGPER